MKIGEEIPSKGIKNLGEYGVAAYEGKALPLLERGGDGGLGKEGSLEDGVGKGRGLDKRCFIGGEGGGAKKEKTRKGYVEKSDKGMGECLRKGAGKKRGKGAGDWEWVRGERGNSPPLAV